MNVRRKPLDSVKIRRAISHAIDQLAIVRHVTRGGEEEAFSLTPPSIRPYRVEEVKPTAREVSSRPLSLLLPENPDYAALATVLANQWKERLGIEIRLDIREWKVYLASRRRGDYDLALSTWIGDYPDATTFLDCFRSGDGNNQTGWADEEYDAHLAAAASAGPERDRSLGQAELRLLSDGPVAPIYHPTLRYLVSPRVKGFATNALGLVRFADLSAGKGGR